MIKINATNEVGIIPDRMPGIHSLTLPGAAVFHALFFLTLNGHGSEPSAGLGIKYIERKHGTIMVLAGRQWQYSPFSHYVGEYLGLLDIGYQ